MPHEIIASLRLILAGPTPLRGGATQKCGGAAPRYFCVSVPDEGGGSEDEVMGVMIDWGSGTPHLQDSLLVGSYIKDGSSLIWL